jgi:hypothetical protein
MPTYEVNAPDGKKYKVNAPDGATEQDAIAYVQENYYGPKKVNMPAKEQGFGEKLSTVLGMLPRQLGLTGRAAIEGGAEMAGMFTDPLAKMVGLPSGGQGGAAVADLLSLPKAETTSERVGQAGAKMLAGGGAMLKGAQAVSKLPGVTGQVGTLLASNPAQQLQAGAGAGLAGGYVKETGGSELAQGVAALGGGLAAPMAVGLAKGIPSAAKGAVEFLAPGLTQKAANPQVDLVISNLIKDSGMRLADVPKSVINQLRDDVSSALKQGNLDDSALRRLADYRLIGATPRRGNLTLSPADITRDKNAAKFGINSADPKLQQLGQVENDNNRILIERLNGLGANGVDSYSAGRKVISSLEGLDSAAKSSIDSLYTQARNTAGRSAPIDPSAFTQRANDLLDEALLGGKLPADVRNLLNKAAQGEMPLTVDVAEQFKTRIGDLQRASSDKAERMALGLVRQALDDAPLMGNQGQGAIDAFNVARSANRKHMSVVERVPALQAVRDGIEPDKFVQQFIIGNGSKASVMDVAKLKAVVRQSPEASQAIRGQIMAHLKEAALGKGTADEIGNFSQSNFNRALSTIGERKLKLFFTPDEVAQIKALGRVAAYEQVQPRGSAVNNSNTAGATGMILLDKLANSPLLSKIPMGPQLAGNISASLAARNALNAPKAVIAPQQGSNPAYPFLLPAAASMGLLSSP